MTDSNKKGTCNPALQVRTLIGKFDIILGDSGVTPVNKSIAASKTQNHRSVLDYLSKTLENISFIQLQQRYTQVLDLVAEIIANIEEEPYFNNLEFPALPEVGHNKEENLREFIRYVAFVREEIQPLIDDEVGYNRRNDFFSAIDSKKKTLDKGFYYEFTEGDLKRIQTILNELRSQISESDLFEEDHRRRLLRRLEALQSEMHKKMSDVDRIWGLVGDAGIAIGKFGRDAKPFVDRIRELSQIAWKTQARAEELPSSSTNPLIEDSDEV